jgi:hypothetical protein
LSNNRSNNRRRGRGNNRSQGGGNQGNRIDSRARGNAPQLLEKYKKMAHDAALNGDRVQAEYYLQFADHYFRVLADSKTQRDEVRAKRDGDRDQQDDDSDDEDDRTYRRPQQGSRDNRDRFDLDDGDESQGEQGSEGDDTDSRQASENPFTRENRNKPRRNRKNEGNVRGDGDDAGFDASVLPPAIGKSDDEEAPKARKPRRAKPRSGDDESLEAVN